MFGIEIIQNNHHVDIAVWPRSLGCVGSNDCSIYDVGYKVLQALAGQGCVERWDGERGTIIIMTIVTIMTIIRHLIKGEVLL